MHVGKTKSIYMYSKGPVTPKRGRLANGLRIHYLNKEFSGINNGTDSIMTTFPQQSTNKNRIDY